MQTLRHAFHLGLFIVVFTLAACGGGGGGSSAAGIPTNTIGGLDFSFDADA